MDAFVKASLLASLRNLDCAGRRLQQFGSALRRSPTIEPSSTTSWSMHGASWIHNGDSSEAGTGHQAFCGVRIPHLFSSQENPVNTTTSRRQAITAYPTCLSGAHALRAVLVLLIPMILAPRITQACATCGCTLSSS